jgi:pentatricopeptide repeat protein
VSFVGILTACANLTSLNDGREVHMHVVENGFELKLFISNALLNMYGKCGSLDDVHINFEKSKQRNLVTWNTIIATYAQRGSAKEALRLFRHMQKEMIVPDQVTFVSILSACVHEALLEEGLDCFQTMIVDFGILPSIEHYGCLVDLFSRFGKLDEAEDLIFSMPILPDALVWNTFLSACKAPSDGIRGLLAMKHIMTLDPQDATAYISLSSMYAEQGGWDLD